MDQDYLHKLSKKDLAWLNKFNKEEVSASFDSKNPRKNFNKSKASRKRCYDRNNARNRDILTRAKASNQLIDYETLLEETNTLDYEDYLINNLDKQELLDALEWIAEQNDKDERIIEENLLQDLKEMVKPSKQTK